MSTSVDAFTGMVSEPHVAGTEFGELQLAMWTRQFEALRDGDRFFYGNDPVLDAIAEQYGIDYRMSLADVIVANTDVDPAELADNVFLLETIPTLEPTASASAELPLRRRLLILPRRPPGPARRPERRVGHVPDDRSDRGRRDA